MEMNRRDFVGWLVASGALAKSSLAFGRDFNPTNTAAAGFSILQGMTDETTAQFSIVLPLGQEFRVEVSKSAVLSAPQIFSRATSQFAVHKFTVDGLMLGQDYSLRVLNAAGEIKDERTFRALDLSRRAVKIAYLSCAMDHLHKEEVWNQLETQKPEMCMFLGDNVYTDRKSLFDKVKDVDPVLMWDRYVQTRNRVKFYFLKNLIPTLAIWDDHDFGGNNVNKDYPFAVQSREIFDTFFAQSARPSLLAGPGIARRLSAFGADFFLCDGRSFRDGAGGRMFGAAQEQWLYANLNPRSTMLLNGSMFFGAYATGLDSFEGEFAANFAEFRGRLKDSGAVAGFASGDVHYSEIMEIEAAQLGHSSFEIVSSSIHSLTFPGIHDRYHNPRRKEADSTTNFMLWEGEFGDDAMSGVVTCWTGLADQFRGDVSAWRE